MPTKSEIDRGRRTSSRPVWRRTLVLTVGASLLLALVVWLAQRQDRQYRQALLRSEGSHAVALQREFLARELRGVRSDLMFLAQQPLVERLPVEGPAMRSALEREYAGFARTKPFYDQIRFLDETGREVVRVNRRGGVVEIAEEAELQSKGDRYYFREASLLPAGAVFVSALDLNVERGEIERPPKPMVRFATPIASTEGEHRGLIVLNYAGATLLGQLREIAGATRGDLMLVNRSGEYLQARDPASEWGWLLGHSRSFRSDHPVAWERISGATSMQVWIDDALFTSEWFSLAEGDATQRNAIAIVSRIPLRQPLGVRNKASNAVLFLGALAAIAALAFYWTRASVARREQERRIAESEARLRALSSRLLAAQEEERRSLSRLLHDELGQRVTAIALDLKSALRHSLDDRNARSLQRAVEEIDEVIASLHELATRVRPAVLDDLGLEEAVESYVAEYQERTGVEVELDIRLSREEIAGPIGENLYRILQEALANVSAHAGTDTARVELVADASGLELVVEDEGRGFDSADLKGSSRLGILGMRERVELLGGEFNVETAPGNGTRIHVWLPRRAVNHLEMSREESRLE